VCSKLAESVTVIKKGTKLFVERKLEITSFTTEEDNKQMAFMVTARPTGFSGMGSILAKGRQSPTMCDLMQHFIALNNTYSSPRTVPRPHRYLDRLLKVV
jgi:hypothetical protein